ncbi:MAG: hypothetical protein NC434_02825 [Ruminococcus sp.]|nr:hypothetical protein [Ruminococcus sp.]
MKKVLLVDYYGTCNLAGEEVGHSSKVLKEYKGLIEGYYEISAALSPCLVRKITNAQSKTYHKIYTLKYDICMENLKSVRKRVCDKFKLFYNLAQVFQNRDYDIMWFYRTDFFLALYMLLFIPSKLGRKKYPKIIIQIYQNSFGQSILGRILNYIYYAGFRKADAIISTQRGFKDLKKPILYIPDYYYDAQKYERYQETDKEDKVVCVGTMSPYKQVSPLVKAFNRNGFPLEIRGYFYDKEQYQHILEIKKSNITVEDAILTEEDYYHAIAKAKYAVLPYDMGQYQCRTSGVLQECVFLDTIAIAPKQLLQENQIRGIGYQDIEELAETEFFKRDYDVDRDEKKKYDKAKIGKRVRRFLGDISG